MSGILGYIALTEESRIPPSRLHAMTEAIRHRGSQAGYLLASPTQILRAHETGAPRAASSDLPHSPDTSDSPRSPNLPDLPTLDTLPEHPYPLGLSCRWHDSAHFEPHQRICDTPGHPGLFVVHCGKIFNIPQLQKELERLGHTLPLSAASAEAKTEADVIAAAYQQWGADCVTHFTGTWSLILWDPAQRLLLCSRDRIGVQQIFYYKDAHKIILASEIKQILQDPGIPRKINRETLYSFLVNSAISYNEDTFFANITALSPAHTMLITLTEEGALDSMRITPYWSIDHPQAPPSEDDYVQVGTSLTAAVHRCLTGDAKIGGALSGGLDSSSVTVLACAELARRGKSPVQHETLTSCYDDHPEVDERDFATAVAEHTGCTHHLVHPSGEKMAEELPRLIWHLEEPTTTPSVYASWCVMRAASEKGIRVLLDGQGGDETLLGYKPYYVHLLLSLARQGRFGQALREFRLGARNSDLSLAQLAQYSLYFSLPGLRCSLNRRRRGKYLQAQFLRTSRHNKDLTLMGYRHGAQLSRQSLHFDAQKLLRYADKTSQAFAVELRLPFMDHTYIEAVLPIPIQQKIHDGWTKNLLRTFFKDKMPAEVVYRKNKMGFPAPQASWIAQHKNSFLPLFENPVRSSAIFDVAAIRRLLDTTPEHDMVWRFITVETLMRQYGMSL
ncbi:MAG: asparagine synthase (glutamine-hydrolyzing) [Peptococcaceae bacterium]|nr:asparagine synthase (glutamine-hydrolyzing) [Peptococcaceae bacterium]